MKKKPTREQTVGEVENFLDDDDDLIVPRSVLSFPAIVHSAFRLVPVNSLPCAVLPLILILILDRWIFF